MISVSETSQPPQPVWAPLAGWVDEDRELTDAAERALARGRESLSWWKALDAAGTYA
jgi:hypothetical protein